MESKITVKSTYQFRPETGESSGALFASPFSSAPESPNSSELVLNQVSFVTKKEVSETIYDTVFVSLDNAMREIVDSEACSKFKSKISDYWKTSVDTLSLSNMKLQIEGFEFNSKANFGERVETQFYIKSGSHKGHTILHIPDFVPASDLIVPDGATNFKISARLISVSNFSKSPNGWDMENTFQHAQVGTFDSQMLPILRIPSRPITSQVSIQQVGNMGDDLTTVLVCAIKFYHLADKRFVHMHEEGMMCIMKVF